LTRSAILDTNAMSALFEGNPRLAELLEGIHQLCLPVIAISEYRYGILRSRLPRQLEPLLETLIAESRVLSIDASTTESYAAVRVQLRDAGHPIPENDVWIAALAMQHGLPVVSLDSHFDAVRDLERLAW
jgi:tRNA(fMet)-specific endonuclease VapC